MSNVLTPLALIVSSTVLSMFVALLVVRAAISYAHRRGMFDQPGQRRSHTVPTPRGGGIGIIVAVLVSMPVCLLNLPRPWHEAVVITLTIALMVVAWIGWWDDHHSLPALPRFGVQLASVAIFSAALIGAGLSWWWLPLLILAGAWSINLHNFMDGIDGLLAQQGIFVACGLALLAWGVEQLALVGAATSVAAACAGFWYYNRSPARIFMGDVGSGSVGLLLFALSAMLWRCDQALFWPVLILSSSFAVDASLTLVSRMLNGRRWYTPHREHLYQWVVRKSGKHAEGAMFFLIWNLLVAAPCAYAAFTNPRMAWSICVVMYLIGAATWLALKRRLVQRTAYKVRHVST